MKNTDVNDTYLFVCCNQRVTGKCCANNGAEKFYDAMKSYAREKQALFQKGRKVKVVKTSCLGKCTFGPNVLVMPDNVWYTYQSADDAIKIIDQHIINGRIINELINPYLFK